MFDMLNNGGHGNDNSIGMEEGTQVKAYDIDGQPFFDVATTDYTAFYTNGEWEDESEDDDDDADPDGDVPVFWRTPRAPIPWPRRRRSPRRLRAIRPRRTFSNAKQKGRAYWKRVAVERRQLKPFKIHSDRGQVSIQK
jgi:hypothetical protein